MRWRNAAFYGIVLAAALWLNANAFAQSVPEFHDGAWVLPAPESVGMGPDPVGSAPVAAQSGWDPIVQDACGGNADCYTRITWLISCESGGDENAVSAAINPGTGMHDYGLLQISPIWGDIAYADGASQIYWTAAHLGTVWWAC